MRRRRFLGSAAVCVLASIVAGAGSATAGVAVGTPAAAPIALGGLEWTPVPACCAPFGDQVAGGDLGFLVWNRGSPIQLPTDLPWFAADGISWQQGTAALSDFAGYYLSDVTAVQGGFLAVGGPGVGVVGPGRLWRTSDGVAWTLVGTFQRGEGLVDDWPGVVAIGSSVFVWAITREYVAHPEHAGQQPVEYLSADGGVTFAESESPAMGSWYRLYTSCIIDGRAVVVGWTSNDGVATEVRASTDLVAWDPVGVSSIGAQIEANGAARCDGDGTDARFAADLSRTTSTGRGSIGLFDHTPEGFVQVAAPELEGRNVEGLVVAGPHQYLVGSITSTGNGVLWTRTGNGPLTAFDLALLTAPQPQPSVTGLAESNGRILLGTFERLYFTAQLPV